MNGLISFRVWACWFLFLSLIMMYGLIRNKWTLIKRSLILGLISKLLWAYALLYMTVHGYPIVATLILWAFLAYVQAWTIIFFVPTITDTRHTPLERERYYNG